MPEKYPTETEHSKLPETTLGPLVLKATDDYGGLLQDAKGKYWRFRAKNRQWNPFTIEEASTYHMENAEPQKENMAFDNIWKASSYLIRRGYEKMLPIFQNILKKEMQRAKQDQDIKQITNCQRIIEFYNKLIPLLKSVEEATEVQLPKAVRQLETGLKEYDNWDTLKF